MSSTLDRAVVVKKETTYGTYVAPDRAIEFLEADTSFSSEPTIVQGQGSRAGELLDSGARSVVVRQDVPGSIGWELLPKGQGVLWELLTGAAASTLVSGTTYQQVATLAAQIPSFTCQEQWYLVGADTSDAFTAAVYSWLGCKATDWTLTMPHDGIPTVKLGVNGRAKDMGQSAVAVTLPATTTQPYHGANLTVSTGTLTAATTTALASATAVVPGFETATITVSNNLNTARPGSAGLKGNPVPQKREITISMTIEHRDNSWETALANQTTATLLFDYSGLALSSGTERCQIAFADCRVSKVTKKVEDGMPKQDIELKVAWTATSLQVVNRTSDSAL